MPNKASTFWPDGTEPSIGDLVSGTRLGKNDRAAFRWTPCPQCGYMRWVKLVQVTRTCMRCAARNRKLIGDKNHRWKGGVRQGRDGYRYITVPENHPLIEMAGKVFVHGRYRYYVAEHRLVMAKFLGRPLKDWELVHHKGTMFPVTDIRNKSDNRIENLELLAYKHEHLPSMSVERIVSALQSRIVLLEAEVARLQSLLDGSQDSSNTENHNLGGYNTLGIREDEGIVQPLSNEDKEQNRCSRLRRKQLRPSPEMVMQNPAKSVKPKSNGHGNAELADRDNCHVSVETLHGASFGMKTKSDSHRKVSQNGLIPLSLTSKSGVLSEQSDSKLAANSGKPAGENSYGNPDLAGDVSLRARVETLHCPPHVGEEKVHSSEKSEGKSASREPTRAALILWRCKNLPNSGNANLQLVGLEHANPELNLEDNTFSKRVETIEEALLANTKGGEIVHSSEKSGG